MMRQSEIKRTTAETDIYLKLELDGSGKCSIDTGCGFLNHMLEIFAKHSRATRRASGGESRQR